MQQLPRGRHGLAREEVIASQRGRMLAAMADAVAEKTFARTTVTDVVKRAGVSRETFYEHFADKEACFLAAMEEGAGLLMAGMSAELRPSGDQRADFRQALTLYLETLASEPAVAQTFLVEVYGAGPEARRRRAAMQRRFADAIAAMTGAETDEDRFACEALVGAVSSLVTMRVAVGEADTLPELADPVMGLIERWLGY
jgi:AcrR family transcriptional regulator